MNSLKQLLLIFLPVWILGLPVVTVASNTACIKFFETIDIAEEFSKKTEDGKKKFFLLKQLNFRILLQKLVDHELQPEDFLLPEYEVSLLVRHKKKWQLKTGKIIGLVKTASQLAFQFEARRESFEEAGVELIPLSSVSINSVSIILKNSTSSISDIIKILKEAQDQAAWIGFVYSDKNSVPLRARIVAFKEDSNPLNTQVILDYGKEKRRLFYCRNIFFLRILPPSKTQQLQYLPAKKSQAPQRPYSPWSLQLFQIPKIEHWRNSKISISLKMMHYFSQVQLKDLSSLFPLAEQLLSESLKGGELRLYISNEGKEGKTFRLTIRQSKEGIFSFGNNVMDSSHTPKILITGKLTTFGYWEQLQLGFLMAPAQVVSSLAEHLKEILSAVEEAP